MFDNISFGQSRRISSSLNYGDGLSFARYKRPSLSKYNKNSLKANNSYNFGYNEEGQKYSSRGQRNSSHGLRNLSREGENALGRHQKNHSQGNIIEANVLQSQSYDQDYNSYKNPEPVVSPPKSAQRDLPSRQLRRNTPHEGNIQVPKQNLNHTISYDDHNEKVLPEVPAPVKSSSPEGTRSYKNLRERPNGALYDSLQHHVHQSLASIPLKDRIAKEDVERQSLEHDRYFNRLNKMNDKQQQIFSKYLVEQLVPAKDKEKQLQDLEKKKREEAKERLEYLDKGSKMNQKALKREYQKFLNNQMKQRERENDYQSQMKRETLYQMKSFAQKEIEKDREDKKTKAEMQAAYRNALQSQEYLKAKQQLADNIKLHGTVKHGGTADSRYTFGGVYTENKPIEKGYIPPNPIVNPVSDPMYNPYFRKDIMNGMNEIKRTSPL